MVSAPRKLLSHPHLIHTCPQAAPTPLPRRSRPSPVPPSCSRAAPGRQASRRRLASLSGTPRPGRDVPLDVGAPLNVNSLRGRFKTRGCHLFSSQPASSVIFKPPGPLLLCPHLAHCCYVHTWRTAVMSTPRRPHGPLNTGAKKLRPVQLALLTLSQVSSASSW